MSNRLLSYLVVLVIICIGIILVVNIGPVFVQPKNEKYLAYNGVRGMAIEHKNILYTLNFSQQNELIGLLNLSLPVGKDVVPKEGEKPAFDRIIVYLFDAPDLVITPIAYNNEMLIFSVPKWNPNGLMKEAGRNGIKSLTETTYDP